MYNSFVLIFPDGKKEALSFMKLLKKAAAFLVAGCTALTCASCGENTATALTVDNYDVRAGIYLYYATTAYSEAINVLTKQGENFDDAKTTKEVKKIMDKVKIDNLEPDKWIQNKAAEHCVDFVEVEREFDALGLKLSGDQLASIDSELKSNMSFYGKFYESAGIGEQSVKDIITNNYKQNMLWEAYYGDDGSVGVKDSDMQDYYADNHLRIKYIEMPLKDGEGNLLKADGKKELEKMADDFMTRLGKKTSSEAALMNEMDFLIEENNHYQTSLSEAAVTTTDDEGKTITTPTTAKATTNEKGETETTPASSDGSGSDESTTTTSATTTTTTASEGGNDTTTTTVTGETTTTTTTAATTTTTAATYSFQYERTLQVSTTATKKEDEKEADTTTTEPVYTPCKAVYDWAANPDTPLLKPVKMLSDDEETIYIVVKMDIRERIKTDDIWSSTTRENVRTEMYQDEFSDMMKKKADALEVKRNEKAFKRYKVLDIDIMEHQSALMSYYYSMYGLK